MLNIYFCVDFASFLMGNLLYDQLVILSANNRCSKAVVVRNGAKAAHIALYGGKTEDGDKCL